ncbi:ABC transporter A family member 8 [Smittium mucronatum]|uniref:ABC transporter A family member 8 n=1 Tax=Smittium mucronatum TaxID=133383 RepID=A0A1R0GN31_9FUNG|nr:ABC transporter A family member 8 [Smittium mucronatum]
MSVNHNHQTAIGQFRALALNKISSQIRLYKTIGLNIALVPILMVAAGGLVGIIIKIIIDASFKRQNLLMCANIPSIDDFSLPLSHNSREKLPKIDAKDLPHSLPGQSYYALNHYLLPLSITDNVYPFSPISLIDPAPSCAWAFDSDYSYSSPYFADPNAGPFKIPSTVDKPDPKHGWLGVKFLESFLVKLLNNQDLPWMLLSPSNFSLGSGAKSDPIPFNSTDLEMLNDDKVDNVKKLAFIDPILKGNSSDSLASSEYGLLEYSDNTFFLDFSRIDSPEIKYGPSSLQKVPWYEQLTNRSRTFSPHDMDDVLSEKISSTVSKLVGLGTSFFKTLKSDIGRHSAYLPVMYYYANITPIINQMPWGVLDFSTVDPELRNWKYTLQIGSNNRISVTGSFPSIMKRMVKQQTILSNLFLRSSLKNKKSKIVHTLRAMPQLYYYEFSVPMGSLIGSSLYPFGITFMISILVIILVSEKQSKIQKMMFMNGLHQRTYYAVYYLHFFFLLSISSFSFVISGNLFGLELFKKTDAWLLTLILFIWNNTQISLSFFLSIFCSDALNSQIFVYFIIIGGLIADASVSLAFGAVPHVAYLIWPPFAIYRIIAKLNAAAISTERPGYIISDVVPGDEIFTCLIALLIGWAVFMSLSLIILGNIKNNRQVYICPNHSPAILNTKIASDLTQTIRDEQDFDITISDNFGLNFSQAPTFSIDISNVSKIYRDTKVALNDVSLHVVEGATFGLIGPNGAGKTTLLSIMTGLREPSHGTAKINGYDVASQREQVYQTIGICPQADILWPHLSVSDHIYFYVRLKGKTSISNEDQVVAKIICDFQLTRFKYRSVGQLSGGQKRLTSIAIAFVGDPKVVFLDEPTTGLDPLVRRSIWDLIIKNKQNRTIVLTTHSMEEVEVLCDKVGVMVCGKLKCVDSPLKIKQKYGNKFLVKVQCNPGSLEKASNFIETLIPKNSEIIDSSSNSKAWKVAATPGILSSVYKEISMKKSSYDIEDWGMSQATLEESFINIISNR